MCVVSQASIMSRGEGLSLNLNSKEVIYCIVDHFVRHVSKGIEQEAFFKTILDIKVNIWVY